MLARTRHPWIGHWIVLAACLGLIAWNLVAGRLAIGGARGLEGLGLPITLLCQNVASLALVLFAFGEISARRRGEESLALPLLARLFVVLVGAWLALVFGPGGFHPARVDCALAAAGLSWALLAAARRKGVLRLPPRWGRLLGLAVFDLAGIAVLLEVCLRLAAWVAPQPFLAQRDVGSQQSIETWRPEPGFLWFGQRMNSGGFNDEEFVPRRPDRPLIALIGDSFASGCLPRMFHYSSVLRERLPAADVANIGIPCIGPVEYLELIRTEAARLHPDLVIVTLYAGNDLARDYRPARTHRSLRRVFDPENALVKLVPERLASLREERRKVAQGLADDAGTEAVQVLTTREQALAEYPWLANPLEEPVLVSDSIYFEAMSAGLINGCDSKGFSLEALGDLLLEMRDAARPARLAVAIIPGEFQVEDQTWNWAVEYVGPGDWERERPQTLIRDLCARADIGCLDLLPALRGVEPLDDGRLHVYRWRETHLNARGCEVVGRELAGFAGGILGLEPAAAGDGAAPSR